MSVTTQAVFLSYASQDAEAAGRICQALRAAGIEVWFDQSELRGGDAWDQSIRKQIKTCALFIPSPVGWGLEFTKIDPLLASLRTDPRFAVLLRKLNFPP